MTPADIERSQYIALLLRLGARMEEGRYRRVFCNRDLNLQSIKWIGFDMDYTLAVYEQAAFDALCFQLTMRALVDRFGAAEEILGLSYDPTFAIRGLTIDRERGHILKIDSHGHVQKGLHGFTPVHGDAIDEYRKDPPVFSAHRYQMLDTLFELPEAYAYAAIVDLEERAGRTPDFEKLAVQVREAIDGIHADGSLKTLVMADLPRYIKRDRRLGATLHRFRSAGKKLFLMTNSFAEYTEAVMSYLLAEGPADYRDWKGYFDVIVTGAKKPSFFKLDRPFFVLDEAGKIVGEEHDKLRRGVVYQHGNLRELEKSISATGDEVLYVGDHIYGDILRSKKDSRWRTAMIIPELEYELRKLVEVQDLVAEWSDIEEELGVVRDALLFETELRYCLGNQDQIGFEAWSESERSAWNEAAESMVHNSDRLSRRQRDLVKRIREISREVDDRYHPLWGPLMKAGNEHSTFGQQIERHADLYTSRVTNFLAYSPQQYHRSPREYLPHELETV